MNIVYTFILFCSLIAMLILNPDGTVSAMTKGAETSVTFGIKLFAIYAVWLSALKILERCGADKKIATLLAPATKFLFQGEEDETRKYISLNLSANLLGMGGAATPMGIKAVETMAVKKNKIMLTVINSCSIQLVPTTILALRAGYGAKEDILIASLIVNVFTTALGILLVKIFVR